MVRHTLPRRVYCGIGKMTEFGFCHGQRRNESEVLKMHPHLIPLLVGCAFHRWVGVASLLKVCRRMRSLAGADMHCQWLALLPSDWRTPLPLSMAVSLTVACASLRSAMEE